MDCIHRYNFREDDEWVLRDNMNNHHKIFLLALRSANEQTSVNMNVKNVRTL